MPLGVTSYVDPGVYVQEKLQPGSVTVTAERILAIVGIAPRTRRSTDEAVIRGKVYAETLTVSGSTYKATLASTSNRDRNNAILYRNAQALGLGDWSFDAALLTGNELGGATVDVSLATGNPYFSFSVDGKDPVVIDFQAGQTAGIIVAAATASAAEVVAWINYELSNALGTYYSTYGTAYSAFASNATGAVNEIISLTSPVTTSASDIKIFLSRTTDAASTISNAAWVPLSTAGVQAASIVTLSSSVYGATDVYTIEYVAVDTLTDPLANAATATPLSAIENVGSFPGGSNYIQDTDYEDTGNTVDWLVAASWAEATLTGVNGPFAIVAATNDEIKLGINGLTPITISLTAGAAQAASAVVADINTALEASSIYGPEFAHVASVSGTAVKLTAPDPFENYPVEKGNASIIELFDSTATAVTTVFGVVSASLPYETRGTGQRPSFGSVYYATYDYTRPSTDYDVPWRVYNTDQLYTYTSPLTLSNYPVNKLAIAGEIAFENGVSSLFLIQIDDTTVPGTPTQNQINAAIDVAELSNLITDVVVLDTTEATATKLMGHVSNMSSLFEKKYRRGWYGMARGTAVGDPDTPDTLVYRAVRTLQPGNTSAGRGRQILCAPPQCSRTLTLNDGREVTVTLDGTYPAVADAAVFVSLPSPSDALLGKFITGFLTDDTFETYLQAERYTLAGNGVNVNTLDAGLIEMLDPLTTEAGGGKVIQFEEPSSSAQKDAVTRSIESVLDRNVKGIVPDDLADFIVDIKTWISLAIKANINNGAIAPYRNPDGSTRDIDLLTDIQVYQDTTDPRSYVFKYWFMLKYVAKRFFGEYSVDNPFFAG
jgi:hypothetical protein